MMRGRVVSLNGVPAEQVKAKDEAAWVLEGDRGITYSATVPEGSAVAEGEWWPAGYAGPPLVSVASDVAQGLDLKVGDMTVVNVLGRNIEARVANLRKVNWRSLGINFVFVYSPNTFAGAPHMFLATATFPPGSDPAKELGLLRETARAFPAVTTVRVKDALDAINDVMRQLAVAIRAASSIALAASILVLGGALAAGQQARIYDVVILKTLGATRLRLLAALVAEYAILGFATAVFGVLAGAGAAAVVLRRVKRLDGFEWLRQAAAGAAALALALTVGLGLAATWRVLGQKPARWLRSL
jgi:putative ABC transport system permease protein